LILDSSAVVAIVEEEQGHVDLLDAVAAARSVAIGAPTLFETAMVLASRKGALGAQALAAFLGGYRVTSLHFGEDHVEAALGAFVRYGKGRHPASLNFGDCMTYATSKLAAAPLLFVGEDFAKTDLEPVRPATPSTAPGSG
jgi:ribonuclease VapC